MNLRVAMTGGSGFVGSRLAQVLTEQGYEIHHLVRSTSQLEGVPGERHDISLVDSPAVAAELKRICPRFVVHLAGRSRPTRDLREFDAQALDTILPAITMAKSLPASTELALFFGSCEEYGNTTTPFFEDQPPKSFSPYGWAKIAAWHGSMMIARQQNVPICWARPFLTFGPRQNTEQLIPTLIRGCLSGEEIRLSPGNQTRDFVFIEDLCRMALQVLKHPARASGQTVNLCTGIGRTVRSVAECIRELCGSGRLLFGALPYRSEEAMTFYGSTEKFERLFGPSFHTNFRTALSLTIEAYRKGVGEGLQGLGTSVEPSTSAE